MTKHSLLKIPPPIVVVVMAVVMWALNKYAPIHVWNNSPWTYTGSIISGFGFFVLATSFLTFRRASTTIDPIDPSRASRLVTHGIFSISRNPMYIAFLLILSGWFTWLGSLSPLIPIVVYVIYTHLFQITREEKALVEKFGDSYLEYQKSVPRWFF